MTTTPIPYGSTPQRRHEANDIAEGVFRQLRALAVRASEGDTEALRVLSEINDRADLWLGKAAAGAREHAGYSWAQIGDTLNITRQGAQKRFGAYVPPEVHRCPGGCGFLFPSERSREGHSNKTGCGR